MPTHNGERWLAATLDSLVAQDDRQFEVLLIDSSSTPALVSIAEQYRDRLDLAIDRRPDIQSWPAKTNLGVERARAPFVAVLHQDDVWLPGRAVKLRKRLSAAPDSAMFLNASHIVDAAGRCLGTWRCPLPGDDTPVPSALLIERLIVQNFIAMPAPVIRRDAWLAVGGMDVSLWYTPDWDLYFKLVAHGPVRYDAGPTTGFRIHGNSLTISGSRSIGDFREQMQVVIDRYACQLPAKSRDAALRAARASIEVNVALALASRGQAQALLMALAAMLVLGPQGLFRYLRDARLHERVAPRLRARFAGSL
jgi:glycosyltransferase involved in cell wall biosynthesis